MINKQHKYMNIKYNAKKTVATITPDEGYKLTDYKEGDDILNFNSYDRVMCPAAKAEKYKDISEDAAAEYTKERDEAQAKTDAEREAKHKAEMSNVGVSDASEAETVDSAESTES